MRKSGLISLWGLTPQEKPIKESRPAIKVPKRLKKTPPSLGGRLTRLIQMAEWAAHHRKGIKA